MRIWLEFLCCTIWLTLPHLGFAHHGFNAHYDEAHPILIEGIITEFQYINPHSFVHVEVTNNVGEKQIRWCEMQARSQMQVRGISENTLRVGDRIRIEGFQARRDPLGCELSTGYLADGTVLRLRTRNGQSIFSVPAQKDGSETIFDTWFRKSFPGAGTDPDPAEFFTITGAAADAANDPLISNPAYRCSAISPIRAWSHPGLPTQILDEGDRIIIRHEFMDAERVIYLDIDEHPTDVARTEMGNSIGHYEDDVLVIHTSMFSEGMVRSDFVRTTNFELTERVQINRDNGDLEVFWIATDPKYYKDILRGSRILIRTTLPMGRYDCMPGRGHGAQMDPNLG